MKPSCPLLAYALTCLLLSLSSIGRAQFLPQPDLKPIQEPGLQKALNQLVDSYGWGPMVDEQRFAVALVIMDEHGRYRLAMLNGDTMVYAASLPKIAILFAALVAAQEGALAIEGQLEQDMHDMIRVSCNPCATRVMERVGRDKLLEILQRPEHEFYDDDLYGGLWVGKDYAAGVAYRRDPLHGLSHGATAYQVARMYYKLFMGSLLDEKHSRLMRDMLSEPGVAHKFVKGLAQEQDMELWRKSGTWRDFHADSVLVQSADADYILVGLIEGPKGELQLQTLARAVHEMVTGRAGKATAVPRYVP